MSFSDLSLDEIVEKLKVRTHTETVEIAERYRFFKRQQQSDKSVIDYMSELCKLAKTCNFARYLDAALRDQFVCSLRDSHIQQELLSMKDLTVAKAMERSQAMEVASKVAHNFQLTERDISCVGQQDQSKQTHLVSKTATQPGSCYRYGNLQHTAMACPHKDKHCNACDKVRHLARVCRSRNSGPQKQKKTKQRSRATHFVEANEVEEASQSSEDDFFEADFFEADFFEAGIHSVAGGARYEKLVTSLKLDGINVKFKVDTGAELSTIPWATYQARLQKTKIHPSTVILHQYDGTVLPIKGEITIQVSLGSQSSIGSFIIVENANSQLLLLGHVIGYVNCV